VTDLNTENIFAAAIRLPSGPERSRFLQDALGKDEELLRTVERMLELHDDAGSFLELSALEREPTLLSQWTNETVKTDGLQPILNLLSPATDDTSLGTMGHFDILRPIGLGGSAVVLLARDNVLGREVALKLLPPDVARRSEATQRFLREARSIASLRDERVTAIYEVGEHAGVPFFVMEYLPAGSLQEHLHKHGSLGVSDCVIILLQVAEALQAAHRNGVLHRDIKPSNVLVDRFPDRVKLSDFGLAHSIAEAGWEPVLGTPQFSSPEQLRGEAVDGRTDLFSLGCLGYALLTGRSPFAGVSRLQTVQLTYQAQPELLAKFGIKAPPALEQLLLRLVGKSVEQRPRNIDAVVDTLRQLANSLPTNSARKPAEPQSGIAPAPKLWTRRAFAASGMSVLGIGAAYFLQPGFESSRTPLLSAKEPTGLALFDQKLDRYLISVQNAVLIDHENNLHPQPNYYWRCLDGNQIGTVVYRFPFERTLTGCIAFVQGYVTFGFDPQAWIRISASADNLNWSPLQSLKLERCEYWKQPGLSHSTPLLPSSAKNTMISHMPKQDISQLMRGASVLYLKAEMFAVEDLPDNEGGSLGPAAAQFLRCRPDVSNDPLKLIPLA
jgi:serine/threonine protein kinase